MTTSAELIDASRLVEDGILTTDTATIARWESCLQEAFDLTWNGRFWHFKLINGVITYVPGGPNPLPDDFGSFEQLCGVFGTEPIRQLSPASSAVVNAYLLGTPNPAGMPTVFTVSYLLGVPQLIVAPERAESLNLTYLRRSPACRYVDGAPPAADEITAFPEQWRRSVLQRGMEWRNKLRTASALAESYETMFTTSLKEMQAREASGGLVLNTLVPWRRAGGRGRR